MAPALVAPSRLRVFVQVGLLLFGAVASSAATVEAQDLAALARKERARRAKIAKPTKVLTEEDGKAAAESGAGSLTVSGIERSDPAPAPAEREGPGDSLAAQEAAWKSRATSVRAALAREEGKLQELERELVTVSADLAPLSAAEAQDPLRLQKKTQKIAQLNQQITAQKTAITSAKAAVAAFEEEARSNSVPPGWLR